MNGRSIAGKAATVTAASFGALAILAATAGAAPTPLEDGIANLTEIAGDDAATKAGVSAIDSFTELVGPDTLRDIATEFTPFTYAAPTFGCGSNGPITTIIAAATFEGPGPRTENSLEPGDIRFSASPRHSGVPLSSGLSVAWVNINTGHSGVIALDDQTEYHMPSLSKTVHTGAGTVVASMWGTIDYPGARCVMTPTVGTFVIPDLPVAVPEAPAAPTEPEGTSPGSGESSSGAPRSQAPAPQSAAPAPAPAPAPAETPPPAPAPAPPAPPAAVTVGG
ncbi:hypothetical protein [Nocardia mangyaensis]|uniref:hypothetical protein n=1 Tax=Nocardia mangyaensis TaxID=2213200 RepID=UPI0026774946|nr:hypothetical protein [Nocardia mangyaensis]MDO3645415.1 hypothetical protein [Nocardia mangyaensis]